MWCPPRSCGCSVWRDTRCVLVLPAGWMVLGALSGGVAWPPVWAAGAALQVGDQPVGQGHGVLTWLGVDLGHPQGQGAAQVADAVDVAQPAAQCDGPLVELFVVRVVT